MLLFERVPERKSPCLKTMAWFRHAVRNYPGATFISKTADDAFVQTIKLEANMRRWQEQAAATKKSEDVAQAAGDAISEERESSSPSPSKLSKEANSSPARPRLKRGETTPF